MKSSRFALASILLLSLGAPAEAQTKKQQKDPALAGTFSDLLRRLGIRRGTETGEGGMGTLSVEPSDEVFSFAGATATVSQQVSPASPCTFATRFLNAASYVPLGNIHWTSDVTELTSSMSFSTGVGGAFQVAVSGSAQIPGGNPGTSVFSGTMTYPDSMFVFCEVWNSANTLKVANCPLLNLGPVMAKQSAGWGGFGVAQSAGLTRARGTLASLTSFTLRVGISGEGSNTAPGMQLCAWMVSVDTN